MRCAACAVTTGPKSASGEVDGPIFRASTRGTSFFISAIGGLLADGHRDRDRHAAFAGRAVAGADQRIDGLVHVGVGHDDHVVFRAAEALHAFAGRAAARVDVLGDRGRADEADGLDVAIIEDGVDRFLVAVDDIEDAVAAGRLP